MMKRLLESSFGGYGLRGWSEAAAWEGRRGLRGFTRRFGLPGWIVVCASLVMLMGLTVRDAESDRLAGLRAQLSAKALTADVNRPAAPKALTGRAQLQAFADRLPGHDDIPTAIQDLLNLAEDEGLTMAKGDYRPETDVAGGFLRYRLTLPVKGNAQAVYRYVQRALNKQPTLALETIAFKRERIESVEMEARIQWVMLTRLPSNRDPTVVASARRHWQ
jgi:hypothetical protein